VNAWLSATVGGASRKRRARFERGVVERFDGALREHRGHDLRRAAVVPGDERSTQAKGFQHGPAEGFGWFAGQVENDFRR
jgi:hypothetical protein